MENLKYSDILRLNKEIQDKVVELPSYDIAVLSNIITSQLNEILEYTLRIQNINAKVKSGDYDNLLENSSRFSNSKLVIVFFESANFVDGFQYKSNLFEERECSEIIAKVKMEIDILFENLKSTSLVIFNKFSSLVFNHNFIRTNNYDRICNELNKYLEEKLPSNVVLFDIDKIVAKISIKKSVDFRYYYSSKALYTIEFYKKYSQFIKPIIMSVMGKVKKVLIFDCDNTLWKGVLGEDGFNGIEMAGKTKGGVVFEEVQSLGLNLSKRGVLIGLCSKNNPEEIENVIDNHPDMTFRNSNLSIKKVNWDNKLANIQSIAKELNIGLDSVVFVDDSDFEVGLIKDYLKEVTVLKVPTNSYEYPMMFRENMQLFYSISETKEDLLRVEMYKNQVQRENDQTSHDTLNSYLNSLELVMRIKLNDNENVPRIAQLTQKTNQFNLTTKRYTESDINEFLKNNDYSIFSFEVADKYGDAGLTGVAILRVDKLKNLAIIDSLLMSCRIIGRSLELAFFDFLVEHLKKNGIVSINASYIKTLKNEQVCDLYQKLGFTIIDNSKVESVYRLNLADYNFQNINYIKINHGREN